MHARLFTLFVARGPTVHTNEENYVTDTETNFNCPPGAKALNTEIILVHPFQSRL